ncbi:Helix-turn-helix domain-containing protein [Pedobacter westerhofensis]|uniref:Helix-turn-helix domain-containing protein n=1 Tax=Pedobacter westerhofensis TaxID=425512 RepID=A0A521BCP4_9SPHI|nr:helix-turn-helix transcriptional regulator [Pedobacter westerhofensis]SMO44741.1 Helix-turn-helix domain-containing protein [Pedobacter westerhofensis]
MGTLTELDNQHIWMPDYLQRELGQFNIFPLYNKSGDFVNCQPYNRKGFYKISLLSGHTRLFYADKCLEFKESALLFSNPYVPYSWENLGEKQGGYYCIFTEAFFEENQKIKDYPIFKPGNNTLFELSVDQVREISSIFQRMQEEIETDFVYKFDVLRNLTLELIYKALKMQPVESRPYAESNGALRVATLFTELLERQFPIESQSQRIRLRFPAEYAEHLSIHINHLNRSLKKVTGKTTSQLIAARIMQEARILLQHTDWNISEISWCLGFEELPHFINFFKKNEISTPKRFRNNH